MFRTGELIRLTRAELRCYLALAGPDAVEPHTVDFYNAQLDAVIEALQDDAGPECSLVVAIAQAMKIID